MWEEFPPADGEEANRLPANLDAAYFSYTENTLFFFKGDDYWQNVAFDPTKHSDAPENSVVYKGKWYDKWYDICDIDSE